MTFYTPRNIGPADQVLFDSDGNAVGIQPAASSSPPVLGFNPTKHAAIDSLVSRDGNVFGPENAASSAAGPQGWTALVPNAGITTSDAAVRISGGRYEFRGTLSGTIASDTVLTKMPAALKVDRLSRQLLPTSTGPATITVQADGAIVVGTVAGSPAAWISLDGLSAPFASMPADPFVSPLPTLPVVRVSTLGQAVPAPALDTYITGTIEVLSNNSGRPDLSLRPIDISGHGNSTWSPPKKPLKLRFPSGQAASMLGMPSSRHWRALANWYDPSQVRNATAFELMRRIYSPWTPRCEFCELYLNDEYQGVYQMTESVRADPFRLPVTLPDSSATGLDATGAYMLEINSRYVAEGEPGFNTVPTNVPIQFDDPSPPSASQITYITNWINTFDATLMGSSWLDPVDGYARFVDMESWADWYLVNELVRNQDSAFFASCKLYKERDTATTPGRLRMGPAWDHDLSMGNGYGVTFSDWVGDPEAWHTRSPEWLNRMLSDPAFQAVVQVRWDRLKAAAVGPDGVIEWARQQSLRVSRAMMADASRWGRAPDARARFDSALTWLRRRLKWMDDRIPVIVARNLIPNPRPSVDLTGFSGYAGLAPSAATLALAAGNPLDGNSARYTYTAAQNPGQVGGPFVSFPAVPGEAFTGLLLVRTSKDTNIAMRVEQRDSGGAQIVAATVIAPTQQMPANEMVALPVMNITPVPTAATIRLLCFNVPPAQWAIGDWIEICGAMAMPGTLQTLKYADPGTSVRWTWDGTAFASASRGWPL